MKKFYFFSLLFSLSNLSLAQVKIGNTNYATLRAAFNAINAGTYVNQNIVILVTGNTIETQECQINHFTPSYQSITIKPSGTGSRT
ncbi:MAG TPA: hypothetical protein VK623_09715, partial [Flavobacterium sp.]|nr:hypothetical protein [Flavobacterium sp.]